MVLAAAAGNEGEEGAAPAVIVSVPAFAAGTNKEKSDNRREKKAQTERWTGGQSERGQRTGREE